MLLMTACLIALLPYFAYVFHFISPQAVIQRIRAAALREIERTPADDARGTKRRVIESVEELEDIARSAMRNSDRGIAMAAVEALATLLQEVTRRRAELPEAWFRVDEAVTRDADFVSMAPSALAEVARERSWFEAKILRQYHALFVDAVGGRARDVGSMIAIHTRQLGEVAIGDHVALVRQCQRAFHSYLRAAINGSDQRSAYYVLHQYRLFGETLLARGEHELAIEVASRFREYGRIASASGLPFLLEVAAYDLAQLVEAAVERPAVREALLGILLEIDQPGAQNLAGVRRAQIQLATFFLARDLADSTQRIVRDLAGERSELLASVREQLEREASPNFWEIEDRGVNFAYLPPERRARLPEFYALLRERR